MKYSNLLKRFKSNRLKIYQDHLKGKSYTDLAKKYDLSAARIYQIIKREQLNDQAIYEG